jgi:sugar diacid utilization regulator
MRELRSIAEAVLRAAKDATVALADGYEGAQRLAIRQEEALRQEFIDDLLYGRSDPGRLAGLAERFGTRLAGAYYVAVVRIEEPRGDVEADIRRLERALADRFGTREILLTSKADQLVCIAPDTLPDLPTEITRFLATAFGSGRRWKVGVGRTHPGPGGIVRSYEQARTALRLSDRLGLDQPVAQAADLLVYEVLLRDHAAISDLVTTVLQPLSKARGGPQPLLDTLTAYFAAGGVTAATARRLHLSVRATAYRLERITKLTGHSVNDPAQRFTLQTAVLGARLLGWPQNPLTTGQ